MLILIISGYHHNSDNRMRDLVTEGITDHDWTEALVKKTFEEPNPDKEDDTALTRGEFDIVKALLAKCPEVGVGKILVDKMVDLAGPDGAGGTHLRSSHIVTYIYFCSNRATTESSKCYDQLLVNICKL